MQFCSLISKSFLKPSSNHTKQEIAPLRTTHTHFHPAPRQKLKKSQSSLQTIKSHVTMETAGRESPTGRGWGAGAGVDGEGCGIQRKQPVERQRGGGRAGSSLLVDLTEVYSRLDFPLFQTSKFGTRQRFLSKISAFSHFPVNIYKMIRFCVDDLLCAAIVVFVVD